MRASHLIVVVAVAWSSSAQSTQGWFKALKAFAGTDTAYRTAHKATSKSHCTQLIQSSTKSHTAHKLFQSRTKSHKKPHKLAQQNTQVIQGPGKSTQAESLNQVALYTLSNRIAHKLRVSLDLTEATMHSNRVPLGISYN